LRIDKTEHHLVNATEPSELYTINDQLVYNAYISKYNPKQGTWEPYSALRDLQLEFTMLDPHVRTALSPVRGTPGKYSVTFRAPDRHGVFKFLIDYKRKGCVFSLFSSSIYLKASIDGPTYTAQPPCQWSHQGMMDTRVSCLLHGLIMLAQSVRASVSSSSLRSGLPAKSGNEGLGKLARRSSYVSKL